MGNPLEQDEPMDGDAQLPVGENGGAMGPDPNSPIGVAPTPGGDDDEGAQGKQTPGERQPNLPGQMPSPESIFGGPGAGGHVPTGPQPTSPSPAVTRPMRPFVPMPGPSPAQLAGGLRQSAGGLLGGGMSVGGSGMGDGKPQPTDLIRMLMMLANQGR